MERFSVVGFIPALKRKAFASDLRNLVVAKYQFMWPWGHLAVGYLVYVGICTRTTLQQTRLTLLALAFGTQFPDLVDKPLAWSFGILPSGRSLGHSLLVLGLLIALLRPLANRYDRSELVSAFGIGAVSHALSDLGPTTVYHLLSGDLSQLKWTTYLLWPLLPAPPYPNDESFSQHFAAFAFDPYVVAQFVLLGVAIVVGIVSYHRLKPLACQ